MKLETQTPPVTREQLDAVVNQLFSLMERLEELSRELARLRDNVDRNQLHMDFDEESG